MTLRTDITLGKCNWGAAIVALKRCTLHQTLVWIINYKHEKRKGMSYAMLAEFHSLLSHSPSECGRWSHLQGLRSLRNSGLSFGWPAFWTQSVRRGPSHTFASGFPHTASWPQWPCSYVSPVEQQQRRSITIWTEKYADITYYYYHGYNMFKLLDTACDRTNPTVRLALISTFYISGSIEAWSKVTFAETMNVRKVFVTKTWESVNRASLITAAVCQSVSVTHSSTVNLATRSLYWRNSESVTFRMFALVSVIFTSDKILQFAKQAFQEPQDILKKQTFGCAASLSPNCPAFSHHRLHVFV